MLEDLGEVLEGDRLVSTPYAIKFKEDAADAELCRKKLGARDLERLRYAIRNDYYFQVRCAVVCVVLCCSWRVVVCSCVCSLCVCSLCVAGG